MNRQLISCLAGCALLFAATNARGQAVAQGDAASTVLTLPGKTVEVLGLSRWTIAMIQDSMTKYAPGESIASHACAAVLRYKLGFADASSTTYMGFIRGDNTARVVVAVVEPQDSARVRHRDVPMDSTRPFQAWAKAIEIAAKKPWVVDMATDSYLRWRHDSAIVQPMGRPSDSADVRAYWRFVAAHASADDYGRARRMLLSDPDFRNRIVAASILANFIDRDETWFALVEAIRETDGQVRGVAATVLARTAQREPRHIDWRPATSSLHAILDGTSVFQLPNVIDVLLATGADPQLAASLLHGGGHMLLSFAGAQHPAPRDAAHRLLVALAGRDLGDVAAWRRWVETL